MDIYAPVVPFLGQNPSDDRVKLDPSIFCLPWRLDIVSRVVHFQNIRHLRTHSSQGRSDVSRTTKKYGKQKGGGRARHGSMRAPQFRGGGVVFGPVVRSPRRSLNKKIRVMGLKTVLSARASEQAISIVPSFSMPQRSTRSLKNELEKFNGGDVIFVGLGGDQDCILRDSLSNIQAVDYLPLVGLNVVSLLKRRHLVMNIETLRALEEKWT